MAAAVITVDVTSPGGQDALVAPTAPVPALPGWWRSLSRRWSQRPDLHGDALPLRTGLLAVIGFVGVMLVASAALRRAPEHLGIAPALIALVGQYAAIYAICVVAVRGHGDGSLALGAGMHWRRRDVFDGVFGWLAMIGFTVAVTQLVLWLGVPLASNNPMLRSGGSSAGAPRWLVLSIIGLVLMVVAPFFEELLFRGVLLRALAGRLPVPVAVVAQAAVFSTFHVDPGLGWGNIGLVLVLMTLGVVLASISIHAGGRLGGSVVAHGLYNAVVFAIGVAATR